MSVRTTLSYILWPFTMWYGIGVRLRGALYTLGVLKQEAPHITTIGVGNLSTGGSGKTPHVEYLLRLLSPDHRTAMLSRGYRRKSKGYQADDGSHDAALLGDEPAMIARKFPEVQVAVCKHRMEGVHQLMNPPVAEEAEGEEAAATPVPEVIVLDDVFQHRSIKPSINILLTEYRHPYYRDHILPYGNLREPRSGRFRAGIVVVTKTPENLNPIERHNITRDLRLQNYQKVFFSYLRYGALLTLDGEEAGIDLRRTDFILALTGIAHPEPLIEHLKRTSKVRHMRFADHHDYTPRDLERIEATFKALPGERKAIVTTEKDAIRLRALRPQLPICVQPVEVAFHQNEEQDFDNLILSSVRENISFLAKLDIWK